MPSTQSDLYNAPPTAVSPTSSMEFFLHSTTTIDLRHYLATTAL